MNKSNRRKLLIILCIILILSAVFIQIEGYTDPILEDLRRQMAELDPIFNDIYLSEGKKSYTINKQKIYICLKDKNGRYYNRNMLIYVLCHEYSHVRSNSIGHTPEFYKIFNNVLKEATKKGIYNPNIPPIKNYCGHS